MLLIAIFILIIASVILVGTQLTPWALNNLEKLQHKKVNAAEMQLSNMFMQVKREWLIFLYTLTPLVMGLLAFLVSNSLIVTAAAVICGSIFPELIIRNLEAQRKSRFQHQLVDALMLMVSSLKAGLSLLQTVEVVAEEMSPPISEEFGLLLREYRMGVTLEDCFNSLNERIKSEELELIVKAILLAKDTGGDLTKVLARLSVTLRDSRKLKDSIRTLTLQGRMQGVIMSALPFLFILWVISFNREYFSIMFSTDIGRMLMVIALVLQVLGVILIRRFSFIRV